MKFQAYYPTYHVNNTQIAIAEYEACSRRAETGQTVFVSATNVMLVLTPLMTGVATVIAQNPNTDPFKELSTIAIIGFIVGICIFSWLTVRYFAKMQKDVIVNQRKMVVLRAMLGLDFGTQQLVLPRQSLAGAGNAFDIKAFPGWGSYIALPFWLVWLTSFMLLVLVSPYAIARLAIDHNHMIPSYTSLATETVVAIFIGLWSIALACRFRADLFDVHETAQLIVAQCVARLLGVELVADFEYTIYRAKLAVYEAERVGLQFDNVIPILVHVEDKRFWRHGGIDYKAIARAFLSVFGRRRKSGGSTITQQLVRTLFIRKSPSLISRKCVELLLARWVERVRCISKNDIIRMYICSVRYDNGVFGMTDAIGHFLSHRDFGCISKGEAFFLVERVSNIHSRIMGFRVETLLDNAVKAGVISHSDKMEAIRIYMNTESLTFDDDNVVRRWNDLMAARQEAASTASNFESPEHD